MSYSEAMKIVKFYENNKDMGIHFDEREEYEKAKEVINWVENSWK